MSDEVVEVAVAGSFHIHRGDGSAGVAGDGYVITGLMVPSLMVYPKRIRSPAGRWCPRR